MVRHGSAHIRPAAAWTAPLPVGGAAAYRAATYRAQTCRAATYRAASYRAATVRERPRRNPRRQNRAARTTQNGVEHGQSGIRHARRNTQPRVPERSAPGRRLDKQTHSVRSTDILPSARPIAASYSYCRSTVRSVSQFQTLFSDWYTYSAVWPCGSFARIENGRDTLRRHAASLAPPVPMVYRHACTRLSPLALSDGSRP